jgi:hypothetical protein
MTDPLRDIAARPLRYENVDGTTEMFFGLMIFAMILMGYLTPIAEKNTIVPRSLAAYLLVVIGALAPFILFATILTRTIKRHITTPEPGTWPIGELRERDAGEQFFSPSPFPLLLQPWRPWRHSFNETTTQARSAP